MSVDRKHQTVRLRFSAAADTYDRHATVQQAAGERLAGLIDCDFEPIRILEVGCGTGGLTRLLLDLFPGADIHAVDLSQKMIDQARRYCGNSRRIQWHTADAAHYTSGGGYHLIISNCAFHWVVPLRAAFENLVPQLSPDGRMIFSIMLEGTLDELHTARLHVAPHKKPLGNLPVESDVRAALTSCGLEVLQSTVESVVMVHDSARAFIQAIHNQGLTGGIFSCAHAPLTRGELNRMYAYYDDHYVADRGVAATYRIGFFSTRRK